VLAHELKRLYTEPVYGVGVLPGRDEGGIYTLNAARSFQTFVREVDNLIVFDNDAWRQSGESVTAGYATLNEELARRLGVLFSAGEVTGGQVAESVVDASEIINTLASGGVSSVGYAAAAIERPRRGLLSRLKRTDADALGDEVESTTRVASLVRRATLGRLTLPCDVAGVERALLVVSGPPAALSRRGIERGRKWLEEETGTMEIRGGDAPVDSGFVAVAVLLSGVTSVPRIKELQAVAVEAQREGQARDAVSAERLAGLLDTDDELDALF
jgi:cell division GTPase FtsZ